MSQLHMFMAALTKRSIIILSVVLVLLSVLIVLFIYSPGAKRQPKPEDQPQPLQGHSPRGQPNFSNKLSAVCKASRDPEKCKASFTAADQFPSGPTILDAIQAAMWLSTDSVKLAETKVKNVHESSSNATLTTFTEICLEILNYSAYRINQSVTEAMPSGKVKDARAWMGAALSYQYSCWAGFQKFVNDSSKANETSLVLDVLLELTSNAASMVFNYDVYGNDTDSWSPPKTEREGFWETVGTKDSDFKGGVPRGLKVNVTVCKDGKCDHTTVQKAVDAAPDNLVGYRFVIHIKEGTYNETVRVPFAKKNLVFLGDGMGKTIITGSLNVMMPGVNTFQSATVGVTGDGFMASNLTFENTAGSDAQQAVAFISDSDQSVIESCEFLGNQDTLYAKSLRQYYKSCRIQGNVDFIFGDSAAFFQDCEILFAPRTSNPEKGAQNVITAHGRIDPAESTGFVFKDCVVNGTEELMKLYKSNPGAHLNYLGRPWKEYSRTVFIDSVLQSLVAPEGWMIWTGDFALKTLYYGEFGNTGPGADTSKREKWSSEIPSQHVNVYSLHNFIQGDEWIPASH